jgi:uncharacterized protein involved in exopolysaccharide biosynthesis
MIEQQLKRQHASDEIDLRELFAVIWQGKRIIIAFTIVCAVASVFYSLRLPNIYKSEALLAPASDSSSLKVPGQLGGLAALAGVNLGGGSDKTSLALEVIRSREFIGRFVEKHDLLVPIMAATGWKRENNSLVINADMYDPGTKQWIRKVSAPLQSKPSLLESYDRFMKFFSISQDKSSGMIRLSVEHYSPFLAQEWASLLVKDINEEMRNRELVEAQKSINYLNQQIAQTNIADIQTMLFSLIEEQTKTIMLANVREEYVFETVDRAIVAEKKSKPSRALICIMAVMLGGFLSMLLVLVRHYFK